MKVPRFVTAIVLLIMAGMLIFSSSLSSKGASQKGGDVRAAVFYGREHFSVRDSAYYFYLTLLLNKLPGYRTSKENIHIYGNNDKLLDLHDPVMEREEFDRYLDEAFSGSDANDLLIFYFTGHGTENPVDDKSYPAEDGSRPSPSQFQVNDERNPAEDGNRQSTSQFPVNDESNPAEDRNRPSTSHGIFVGWNLLDITKKDLQGESEGFGYSYNDLLHKLSEYKSDKVVIIIDACCAGWLIEDSLERFPDPEFRNKVSILTSTDLNSTEAYDRFTQSMIGNSGGDDLLTYGAYDIFNGEFNLNEALSIERSDSVLPHPIIRDYADENNDGVVDLHEAFIEGKGKFRPSLHHSYSGSEDTDDIPLFQFQYLEIDKKKLKIYEGNEFSGQLKATRHYNMEDKFTIRWTSEDNTIATVDNDGKVTGLKDGTTTITARLYTNEGIECMGAEASCEVTVKKVTTDIIDEEVEIYVGEEYALDYVIEGKDKNTTWTSSDESVATVSKKGKVKALKPGYTTITLEANYKSDSALISVLEPYIEADYMTIMKGESRQLPYKIFGPKEDIKFSSADKTIASIDKQGVVTGHQAGSTQITLSANNVSTTVVVTVEEGNAWAKYIDENYASELGYASLDSASKTVGQNWNYPSVWDKRRGILGAQTADLDYDGIDECVLYYFDTKYVYEPGGNTITNDPKTTLYARVLSKNQNGEIVATPGRQIFFCDSISFCDAVGGILNVEGLKYVYFEVNTSGYYSNFGNTMYSFFTFDGKNFSVQMAAGKTGGGSSELEYGIIRSDDSGEYTGVNVTESSQAWYWEDGKYSKQLLCVDRDWHGKGGQPLMNNFDPEDAMKMGLESLTPIKVDKIKLENGPASSYPTYRTNDAFSQGFHYNCNGRQGSNGARAMKITVEDNTGLRNYLTQSDNKEKQPEKSEKNENGEYILPFSSERYLTEADLDPLSEWELKLARNEIYARHGRRFIDPELQAYFDSKSWYKGIYDPQDFDKNHDSDISELEKKNAEFILKYEKDHNYFT